MRALGDAITDLARAIKSAFEFRSLRRLIQAVCDRAEALMGEPGVAYSLLPMRAPSAQEARAAKFGLSLDELRRIANLANQTGFSLDEPLNAYATLRRAEDRRKNKKPMNQPIRITQPRPWSLWIHDRNHAENRLSLRFLNFSRADLRGADLEEADLVEANLAGADLTGANLRRSNMLEANLTSARLDDADLTEAILDCARLESARAHNANFNRACMLGTKMRGADLRGAVLSGASCDGIRPANLCLPPASDELKKCVADAVQQRGALDMEEWHTCETVHCLAGWAIHLSGFAGYALERTTSPSVAGSLLLPSAAHLFFRENEDALEWAKSIADKEVA